MQGQRSHDGGAQGIFGSPWAHNVVSRRNYAPVATRDTFLGPQLVLHRGQHHPATLVTVTTATFTGGGTTWTERQRIAVRDIFAQGPGIRSLSMINSTLANHRTLSMLPPAEALHDVLMFLNDLFFSGSIDDVHLQWDSSIDPALGTAQYSRAIERHLICLNPDRCLKHTPFGANVLGVMLHELCHTYFNMFCCRYHTTFCPLECRDDEMKHIGVSGHGPAWVRLASHVEGIAKQYLDKDIDLHIEDALFTELATPGPSSILDEEETARCHVESQAMLMQFRLLADVPVSELKRYIEVLEAAVESQYMIVVPVSEIKRHVKVREAAERNALRRQQ